MCGAYDAEKLFRLFYRRPVRITGVIAVRQGKTQSLPGTFVPHVSLDSSQWLLLSLSLRGKTAAFVDPASVTDEMPVRDSAGRDGPADSGLAYDLLPLRT